MTSRILSLAAVIGLLGAAGCSGGGTGTAANGLAPKAPVTTGSTKGTSSLTASFLIPISGVQASAMSAGRKASYLSPGTNGITVLMGNGTLVVGSTGLSGTAQLTGSVNETGAAAQSANVSFLSASNSTTPVVGQTLTIQHLNNAGNTPSGTSSAVLTITAILSPTIVQGTFVADAGAAANAAGGGQPAGYNFLAGDLITFTATGASSNGQQFIIGNQNTAAPLTPTPVVNATIPASVYPATATSTYSYNFAPSTVAGYYVFNLTLTGLLPSSALTLGVVTNDTNHNNFVLSEAQQTYTTATSGDTAAYTAFTLKPVINGAFVPAPTFVKPVQLGNPAANPVAVLGTYETTVFAVDELGYIIPNINAEAAGIDNEAAANPMVTVAATTATDLLFRNYTVPGTATGPSLTIAPTTGATAADAVAGQVTFGKTASDYVNVTGFYYTNLLNSAPNSPTLGGAANPAGTPVNIVCNANKAAVAWGVTIQSAAPAASVVGYVLTPGTNYPSNTAFTTALPALNCSPGIGAVIN